MQMMDNSWLSMKVLMQLAKKCVAQTLYIYCYMILWRSFLISKLFCCMLSDLISEDRQKKLTMVDLTFWHVSTWKRQEWIHFHNIYAPRKKRHYPLFWKIRFIPRIFLTTPSGKLQDLTLMTFLPRMDSPLSSWYFGWPAPRGFVLQSGPMAERVHDCVGSDTCKSGRRQLVILPSGGEDNGGVWWLDPWRGGGGVTQQH